MSDIAVVGAGYVGLTTAACLARLGHSVTCADLDQERVRAVEGRGARSSRRACPRSWPKAWPPAGCGSSSAPPTRPRGASSCSSACRRRSRSRARPTSSAVEAVIQRDRAGAARRHRRDQQVDHARRLHAVRRSSPQPGAAPATTWRRVEPRVPARGHRGARLPRAGRGSSSGATTPPSRCACPTLYRDVQAPILVTDPASAEMIKYASNAFLATKISFINAIANLCEAVNADVREVALGMGYDPRIGFEFLHPGPGLRRLVLPQGHRRAHCTPPRRRATTSACSRAWST